MDLLLLSNSTNHGDRMFAHAAEAFVETETYEEWEERHAEITRGQPDGTLLRAVLDSLRTLKTDEEMALLQNAIDMTVEAHREAAAGSGVSGSRRSPRLVQGSRGR